MKRALWAVVLVAASALWAAESPLDWNNLGARQYAEGKYAEAETSYRKALHAWQQAGERREQSRTMNNLAVLYAAQGRYREAEETYRTSLELSGPGTFESFRTLSNLAELHVRMDDAAQAERDAKQSVAMAEKVAGAESPEIVPAIQALASVRRKQGRLADAAKLLERAQRLIEKAYGPASPMLARNLANQAEIQLAMQDYAQAEAVARKALEVSPDDSTAAQSANNLAQALRFEKRYEEAEPLYRRAIECWQRRNGATDVTVGRALGNLAGLYHDQEKEQQSVRYYQQAVAILEKSLGGENAEAALVRTRLAEVRRAQGHYAESLKLYRGSLPLLERSWGLGDPRVVSASQDFRRTLAEAQRHTIAVP